MAEPTAQVLEAQLAKLRALLEQTQEVGLPTNDIEARIAQLEAQLGEITDAQMKTWASILSSPRAQQIIGNDNVQIYIEQYIDATRQAEVKRQFQEYLRALWGRLVNLPMLAMTGRSAGVPLAAVYTALDVTGSLGISTSRKAADLEFDDIVIGRSAVVSDKAYLSDLYRRVLSEAKAADDEQYTRQVTALEAAAGSPRLALIGPAGSGKSTFAKFLALCLAGQFLDKNEANLFTLNQIDIEDDLPERWMLPWPHGRVLPIFVELRHFVASDQFSRKDVANPERRLLDYLEAETEFASPLRDYLHESGRALLILDGLDEVPQAEQSRVQLCEVVAAFTQRYEGCRVLVTSRPYAYEEGSAWRLDHAGFNDASLAPFDDEQIEKFIHAWYMHLAAQNQVPREQVEVVP
jgi:predicted NACHT family NTPase